MGARSFLRGLVYFIESAGATLIRRGGGAELTLTENFGLHSGKQAYSRAYGERSHAAGAFDSDGDAQHGAWHARGETSDDTPTVLTLDGIAAAAGSGTKFVPATGEIFYIRAKVCAGDHGTSKAIVTEIKWAVTNFGGTLVQLGATNTSFSVATAATTWTVAPYVANDIISITVTGAVGAQVRWSAEFQYCVVGKSG